MCRQRVRPLPLQPRPVHNAMSIDRLHTQQVYIGWGGVGWGGVVALLKSHLSLFLYISQRHAKEKKKICSILHVILRRFKNTYNSNFYVKYDSFC